MKNKSFALLALLCLISIGTSSCALFKRERCKECPEFTNKQTVQPTKS